MAISKNLVPKLPKDNPETETRISVACTFKLRDAYKKLPRAKAKAVVDFIEALVKENAS